MKTKKNKPAKVTNRVEEAAASYSINKRSFPYNSIRPATLEELEEENRFYSLNLSPVQRLAYLHELNLNAYGRKSALIKGLPKTIKPRENGHIL